jgi:hypothetical protein
MLYGCSFCHARFEAEPTADKKCPKCGAEAGMELVPSKPPPQMRYFGLFLLVTTILALGSVLIGVAS